MFSFNAFGGSLPRIMKLPHYLGRLARFIQVHNDPLAFKNPADELMRGVIDDAFSHRDRWLFRLAADAPTMEQGALHLSQMSPTAKEMLLRRHGAKWQTDEMYHLGLAERITELTKAQKDEALANLRFRLEDEAHIIDDDLLRALYTEQIDDVDFVGEVERLDVNDARVAFTEQIMNYAKRVLSEDSFDEILGLLQDLHMADYGEGIFLPLFDRAVYGTTHEIDLLKHPLRYVDNWESTPPHIQGEILHSCFDNVILALEKAGVIEVVRLTKKPIGVPIVGSIELRVLPPRKPNNPHEQIGFKDWKDIRELTTWFLSHVGEKGLGDIIKAYRKKLSESQTHFDDPSLVHLIEASKTPNINYAERADELFRALNPIISRIEDIYDVY